MNNFLDVIKVRDCIRESRENRDTCKCKDCRKHDRYLELSLPENLINNIYGFTYQCRRCRCEDRQGKENMLEDIIKRNTIHRYHVDKLIFSVKNDFPSYDCAKNSLFRNLAKKKI